MSSNSLFNELGYGDDTEESPGTVCIEAELFGVKSIAHCPQCGQPNDVVTLGVAPVFSYGPCREFKFFTIFGITELSNGVENALKKLNPNYGLCRAGFSNEPHYLNACAACHHVFEEHELRFEPGDAFRPVELADYERIQLIDLGREVEYQLSQDEDEERIFDGIEANCWNPAADLWQVIVEQQSL